MVVTLPSVVLIALSKSLDARSLRSRMSLPPPPKTVSLPLPAKNVSAPPPP
jgi:hypothetical protein